MDHVDLCSARRPSGSPGARLARLGLATGLVAASLLAAAAVGPARPAPAEAGGAADEVVVAGLVSEDPAEGIHPAVAELPTSSDELDAVSGDLRATLELQASATTRRNAAGAQLEQLAVQEADLEVDVDRARDERDEQSQRVRVARRSLQAVALDAYVQAGGSSDGSPLDPSRVGDELERDALAGTVRQHHSDELADATDRLAEAEAELVDLAGQLDGVRADITATTAERDDAVADLARADAALPGERAAVDGAWRTSMVDGTDIPLVAVDAYYRAATAQWFDDPSCGLRWEAIAGIGRVEGHHASFGASELQPDGTSEPRIYGIPLDGTRGTRVIGDSDGGTLDGLSDIDRAVGPMQFIPSTWARWATDGNGDGTADPHSLYDAARTAAVYLCQAGPGLSDDEGLLRSFYSYNRSAPYGQRVLALTHEYDELGL